MRYFFLALLMMTFLSCKQEKRTITNRNDYRAFLSDGLPQKWKTLDEQIHFWEKRLERDNGDLVARSMMASLYARRFAYSGDVQELKMAEDLYREVNKVNKFSSSSTFRSLAGLCITQHKFRLAKDYLDSAIKMGDDKFRTLLLLSDVKLELGDDQGAILALNMIKGQQDFEVMIRRAKIQDKVFGDLPGAIRLLESASNKPEARQVPALSNWIHSNLGDMYGHAGRFKEAYQAYLSVLKNDPAYYHCLKGIAWLALSHDHDAGKAREIALFLRSRQPLPDHDLLLAAVEEMAGNPEKQRMALNSYLSKVSTGHYGGMYNAYTCKLYLDLLSEPAKALALAEEEVKQRPAIPAYSLLSSALMAIGEKEKALEIAKTFVEGRTSEPDALYRLGLLYAGIKKPEKARSFLAKAEAGAYELGPFLNKKIEEELYSLSMR